MDMLVDRAVGIFEHEPIDIYVNPTYIPDQLAAQYDAALDAGPHEDESSTASRRTASRWSSTTAAAFPAARSSTLAKQAGVKFTCGTNNAGAADLGHNEFCAEMITAHGLGPQHFWTPPRDGAKAVQRRPLLK